MMFKSFIGGFDKKSHLTRKEVLAWLESHRNAKLDTSGE